MKKNICFLPLITLFVFLDCSSNSPKKSPPIAHVKQLRYEMLDNGEKVLFGWREGGIRSFDNYEIFFNNEGDTITHNELAFDGSIYNAMTMTYDENKRLIHKRTYGKDFTYEYNELGKLLYYKIDGEINKKYLYDEDGKLLRKINYSMAEYDIIDNDIYVYDQERLIKVDGLRNTKTSFGDRNYISQELKYDENGNLIERLLYLGVTSIPEYREKYTNGKMTEKVYYQLASNLGTEKADITSFYNDEGLLVKKTERKLKTDELSTTDYKYDDKNNLIEEIVSYSWDKEKRYIYYKHKHDKYGNLTEIQEYHGDEKKPSYITLREIEYIEK